MARTTSTGSLIALALDKASGAPLYRQLVEGLRAAIQSGRMMPGARLPSTRAFADEFGVSRNTVLQVFETLTAEGYLVSRVGAGTFVTDILPESLTAAPAEPAPAKGKSGGGYPFRSLSRRGKHLVQSATGEFSERPTPFMPDLPDLREFPIRTWLRLLNETSGRLTGEILADATNAGYEPLRRAIAQHVASARGVICDASQVIVTTGSQQSLDLVCRLLLDSGDPVWIEEPGYTGARAVIAANGGVVHPVPVDAEGMRVEEAIATRPVPRLVFVCPSRNYPLGATLSRARRELLIELARSAGTWLLEDDYDAEFRYAGAPVPAIQGLDAGQRTVYMGTFSKVLLPSFRLGFVIVPKDLADAFARARAVVDRHASLIEQMVLSEFMHRGFLAAHIRKMRGLYHTRQTQTIAGLAGIFGPDLALSATDTGTHVVLPLADDADDRLIARQAAEAGVMLRPLSPYHAGRERRKGLIVGFSAFTSPEIEQGLARLAGLAPRIAPLLALANRPVTAAAP